LLGIRLTSGSRQTESHACSVLGAFAYLVILSLLCLLFDLRLRRRWWHPATAQKENRPRKAACGCLACIDLFGFAPPGPLQNASGNKYSHKEPETFELVKAHEDIFVAPVTAFPFSIVKATTEIQTSIWGQPGAKKQMERHCRARPCEQLGDASKCSFHCGVCYPLSSARCSTASMSLIES